MTHASSHAANTKRHRPARRGALSSSLAARMHVAKPSTGTGLRLATHVRACRIDDQVILLDLRRGKYIGVAGPQLRSLANEVEGWPGFSPRPQDHALTPAIDGASGPLLSQGLLTRHRATPSTDGSVPEATASLDFQSLHERSSDSTRRVCRFVYSTTIAAFWLRCRSLHAIATAVAARRDRTRTSPTSTSIELLCQTATAYERLRPFVYTSQDKCLRDSLALTSFLQREGLVAHWVIGVKTRPFGAHSWVQSDTMVLNDQHDHVRQFTPILVV